MKKLHAVLLALSLMPASLYSSVIRSSARESLIITRDDTGTVTITTSNSSGVPVLFGTDSTGACTGLNVGEHGELIHHHRAQDSLLTPQGAIFITDSSGLTLDMLKRSWMPDAARFMTCREITWENLNQNTPPALELIEEDYPDKYKKMREDWFADLFETYGSDIRVYSVGYKQTVDETAQLTREIMLEYDSIKDVVIQRTDTISTAYWNGEFSFTIRNDYEGIHWNENGSFYVDIPEELETALQEQKQIYNDWYSAYTNWMNSIDADSMTPAQLELSRKEAGIPSDYEMMMSANQAYEAIVEQYSNIILRGGAHCATRNQQLTMSSVSLWEPVGDIDEDGKISAADAALLLQAAAAQGTGEEIDVPIEIADVNADYSCNASDAALLLSYAAQQGAGSELSLKDFTRTIS